MRWECYRGTGSGKADHFIEKRGWGNGCDKAKSITVVCPREVSLKDTFSA